MLYRLSFTEVEGRHFLYTMAAPLCHPVATRQNEAKAHLVGNNLPDQYVGHPHYRCVTVINFQKKIPAFLRRVISAVVRRRFRAEANTVQARYSARQINHSPRSDLFAIADFDGGIVRQLGIDPVSNEFGVFIFDGRGRLVRLGASSLAPGIADRPGVRVVAGVLTPQCRKSFLKAGSATPATINISARGIYFSDHASMPPVEIIDIVRPARRTVRPLRSAPACDKCTTLRSLVQIQRCSAI